LLSSGGGEVVFFFGEHLEKVCVLFFALGLLFLFLGGMDYLYLMLWVCGCGEIYIWEFKEFGGHRNRNSGIGNRFFFYCPRM